nr:hypothetical protein [Ruminiclostridium papyrosolvens]
MDSQDQEIKTIRGRTITLELSDADVERIWNKAGSVNLTVSKLLENFIGDLVWGTYTNGSDERMYANEWFERCGFGMFSHKTFLGYLLEYGCIKESIGLWEDIKDIKEELEYAKVHPAEYDADEIKGLKEDLIDWQSSLDETFGEYKESAKNEEVGTLDEEMETVIEWYEGMKQMKNSNTTLYKKDEDELENDMER